MLDPLNDLLRQREEILVQLDEAAKHYLRARSEGDLPNVYLYAGMMNGAVSSIYGLNAAIERMQGRG